MRDWKSFAQTCILQGSIKSIIETKQKKKTLVNLKL